MQNFAKPRHASFSLVRDDYEQFLAGTDEELHRAAKKHRWASLVVTLIVMGSTALIVVITATLWALSIGGCALGWCPWH